MVTIDQFPDDKFDPERWRIGFDHYKVPPKHGFDNYWKYTLIPKRRKRFNDVIFGVGNIHKNKFTLDDFRTREFRQKVHAAMTSIDTVPFDLFEALLPFLRKDRRNIRQHLNTHEKLREYFFPIICPTYPKGFFDHERFKPSTLENFFI